VPVKLSKRPRAHRQPHARRLPPPWAVEETDAVIPRGLPRTNNKTPRALAVANMPLPARN
jgi:hypothetical protein